MARASFTRRSGPVAPVTSDMLLVTSEHQERSKKSDRARQELEKAKLEELVWSTYSAARLAPERHDETNDSNASLRSFQGAC